MNVALIVGLLAACVVLMLIERTGVRTTLDLHFKGDVKRETRWFAQYGQSACTPVVFLLVWDLDPRGLSIALPIGLGVAVTALVVLVLKRLIGRVRPGRENAGKFLGPSWKHANFRESFPSNHTACAVALSALLSHYYPQAALTFWGLAVICALLRYVLDAHWPSDVVGGALVGILMAWATAAVAARV
jgi:undecaprenyl-diphosphatase